MKLICYLMFFLFFGITSCTSTSKKELKYENGTIDVINLKLYQKENIIRLSEIADSIHYISLETSDSCLIGAIDKILRTDNSDIIVVDKDVASSIFVFNDEGRFKCRIGTRGLGMAEYIKIEDVTYGYGFIYVWDSVQKKVLKYSENGDFLDSYKFDYTAYSLCCINENLLSFCCDYTPNYSLYKDKKLKKPCNVVVVGGGTAGLEAACTAAEVGCATVLIEKSGELGGLARRVGKMPNKQRLGYFPQYLERRAMKLKNLFICKNTEASIEFIEGFKPDIVVNATGSVPLLPNIPGLKENLEAGNVSTIFDLVDHVDSYPEDLSGKKVVVIGGGNVGLDVVEFFVPRKADVTIVEQKSHFGENLDFITKTGSIEFMNKNKVNQYPNASLLEVKDHSFIVRHDYKDLELDFDYGFVCLGMQSATPSLQELYNHFIYEGVEVLNIGDSAQTRRIIEGVKEGRDILVALERQDFI